jgi:hypothetical protein
MPERWWFVCTMRTSGDACRLAGLSVAQVGTLLIELLGWYWMLFSGCLSSKALHPRIDLQRMIRGLAGQLHGRIVCINAKGAVRKCL